MSTKDEDRDTLVDLGVASDETKGELAGIGESVGRYQLTGLTDD